MADLDGLQQANFGSDDRVARVGSQKRGVAIVVAGSDDYVGALGIVLHELKHLAHLLVRLLLAAADVDDGEERLGPAKSLGEPPQVVVAQHVGRVERIAETFEVHGYLADDTVHGRVWVDGLDVLLNLGGQQMSSFLAALQAFGDKVFSEDSTIAINNCENKRIRGL